jgi:antitoxin (DNA-binding transcriptional repressor) of toxin-antitoxin stability system
MTTLPISLVGAELPLMITQLAPGETIVLIDGDKPIAHVTSVERPGVSGGRRLGSAKGKLRVLAEDDDHLTLEPTRQMAGGAGA